MAVGLPVIPHVYRAPGSTWAGGTAGPSWPSPPALPRDTPSLAHSIPKMPTGLLPGMAAKPRPPPCPSLLPLLVPRAWIPRSCCARRGPAPLPPAPRPGSCTGPKAANSQLFSCILKIRGLGNIEQMSGRMRRGGINGLAPGRQHLGSPGVTTWPPRWAPRGPPSRQHEGLLRRHIPAPSLPILRPFPATTIPVQARRHIPLQLRGSRRRRTAGCWGEGRDALLAWHLLPLPFSRECTRFRCRFGGLAHGAVSPCGAVDVGFDHHFQGAQWELGLGGLPTALISPPGYLASMDLTAGTG